MEAALPHKRRKKHRKRDQREPHAQAAPSDEPVVIELQTEPTSLPSPPSPSENVSALPTSEVNPPDVAAASPVPSMSLIRIYLLFLSFGIKAFGGPAVQIQALKHEFVEVRKWITMGKFNRVLAVYQVR